MSWNLGSTTIPEPQRFNRDYAEKSVFHDMINGTSKRDITSRKEIFHLGYTRKPQDVVSSILAEYALNQTLMFSVESGELSIAPRLVHVSIKGRQYNTKGSEFREDFVIELLDVDSQF